MPVASAFIAGLVSFASACVLPLLPGYLAFIAGVSLASPVATAHPLPAAVRRWPAWESASAFIVGFSAVFIALCASESAVGRLVSQHVTALSRAAGVVVAVVGAAMLARLAVHARLALAWTAMARVGLALALGAAFAFGWSPCVGPVLSVILALANTEDGSGDGVRLLVVYSAGLAVPMVAAALATGALVMTWCERGGSGRGVAAGAGLALVATGAAIVSDRLTLVAQFLSAYLPTY